MPVVQTSTYSFADTAEIVAHTEGRHPDGERGEYGRYGNPTVRAVEQRLAALEGTEDAALFSSGMGAMTTSTLALTKGGAHIVLFQDCYRMTLEFVTDVLARFGVTHTLLPAGDVGGPARRAAPRDAPRAERVADQPVSVVRGPRARGGRVQVAADGQVDDRRDVRHARQLSSRRRSGSISWSTARRNTSRATTTSSRASSAGRAVSSRSIRDLRGVLGGVCDPHAAFLVGRGLKTLSLRVERQNATALALAQRLEKHPRIERVFYPGLASHPSHAVARAQMRGFGGVVSFIVKGGLSAASRMVDAVKLARIGPSFGGVESLIEQPAVMSYYEMTTEQRAGHRHRRRPRPPLGRHRGHGRHHRRHRAGARA